MNRNKVRVSLTSDGKPLINNQHEVSLSKLYGMGKGGRNKLFSKLGPADTSTKNAPTRIYASTCSGSSSTTFTAKTLEITISTDGIIKIAKFLKELCRADQEFVAEVLSQLSAVVHDAFLLVCIDVASYLFPGDPHYNARVVYFIFDCIKSKVKECDYENDSALVLVLKSWIKNGRVDKDIILMLKDRFMENYPGQAKIGAFHNDPNNYDYIYEFRKRYKRFMTLRVGEEISIKCHKIIVKYATVDKLEKWLENYSQERCDLLVEFAFKIISMLTADEVYTLNLINPDDDIILRVVHYLFHEVEVSELLNAEQGAIDDEVVLCVKNDLLRWRSHQTVREHKICESCSGMFFE